ncbi:hypothetical protein [uncultured Megasphaera sp.]|uniref:hypothetical protein n=1 Tax=uncultured Megasphaera sp. TaxID=165188 RepID=UPI002585213E|nr:hypothetical protein [uncultured Megasphaera sp.]
MFSRNGTGVSPRNAVLIADYGLTLTIGYRIPITKYFSIFTVCHFVVSSHNTNRRIIRYGIGRASSRPAVYDDVIRRIGRHPHTGQAQSG